MSYDQLNPYLTPNGVVDPPDRKAPRIWLRLFRFSIYLCPLAPLMALYGCWFTAWWMQGEVPVPMRDDPKSFGPPMTFFYPAAFVVIASSPLLVLLGGFLLWTTYHRAPASRNQLRYFLFGLLCLGSFLLFFWDPLDVGNWFVD